MISYHTCPLASIEGKETGGMNVYVYELSRNLARLGHAVDVITRSQDKQSEKIVLVEKNFRVIHLPAGPEKVINKKKLIEYIPSFTDSFIKFSKEENLTYDLMHAHYYQSGLIGLEINKRFNSPMPMVMTFHTLALMKNLVARSVSELGNRFRIDAEFKLTKQADAIITPSSSDKQYLKYLYRADDKKVFEIPPGVNTELFKPMDNNAAKKHLGLHPKEKFILFVGRIEPLKGIDMLLYALKILQAQVPYISVRLLIVGGDISQHITKWSSQLKQLDELRHILEISKQVEFVGQKPQDKLLYYYNAAELVVMPSHYESFGMAAAEAMACGTPVITTNVSGISYLIDERHSTLITTVNNPLLLASQIRQLLTNKTMYGEIRKNIMNNIEDLCWSRIVKQVEEVYAK